ncbi:MAG: adenylate/guanylate cyclase domain-containing protein [Bauldia sp.]
MAEAHTNRRLAAILAADVVGYSRLMASDEAGTLAALKRHRELVFDPAVAEYGGRVIKLMGDGTLVEFASVVDAVNCALSVQNSAISDPAGRVIVLRIGINLGDVIIDGDDLYGDGVNIAARLEPLAEPGGICIASIVNESVGTRIDVAFTDGGEVHVKNIDRPVRIWKWRPGDRAAKGDRPGVANPTSHPESPSIAVLPFANMSGDPEQEYFTDGITEDIITDLSKVAGLLVIARNSSFAYKGKHVDVRTIANELRVRSVLEGSIRRAGNRVRITAQLIDAGTGGHLWAERYDRDLTDIFAVQDEVTQQIVAALKITLSPSDKSRLADDGGTTNVEAHDLYLRGGALLRGPTKNREVFERMSALFRQAIDRDPAYARVYAALGIALALDYLNRWSDDPDRSLAEARRLTDQAIEKGPNEPMGHHAAALVAMYGKDFQRWTAEVETTLSLSPNFSLAHSAVGEIKMYSGEPMAAIPHLERAMRLDPAFHQVHTQTLGMAYLIAGKYETAAAVFRERILLVPDTDISRAYLAAALGHLGGFEEARRVWHELKAINPKYSFAERIGRLPFRDQADVERIADGLRKAGLPD